jgi:electron transfer flavoprotein alpha subunit
VSSGASIQHTLGDTADFLEGIPRGAEGWARYRLGLSLEEMFAVESITQNLIGLYDDKTSDSLRMEAAIAKLFGTDGLHRNLHFLEPLYGIDGQTQRFRIEKDRRDARVMTIYEGTNEIQQFLLLGDLLNAIGPKLEKLEAVEINAGDSPFAEEAGSLGEMLQALHERVNVTRSTYKREAFGRVLLQPIFFRLSRMMSLVKCVDSVVHRAHWISRNLTAEGDEVRKAWSEKAAHGFVARAKREFQRLLHGFDRDFETLKSGGHTAELKLVETVFDETETAASAQAAARVLERVERSAIRRDLNVVVALEHVPRLAPRPRLEDKKVAEHIFSFTAGDRRALRLALALKQAAPDRVQVTLITAAPHAAEDPLRLGLATGADQAILLNTRGAIYTEHAVAAALTAALQWRGIEPDLLLAGASGDSPSDGRLALRLAAKIGGTCIPGVTDFWMDGDAVIFASERFPETLLRIAAPSVAAVPASESEPEWDFTTAGYAQSLRKPLEVLPFPADAEQSDEVYSTAAAAVTAEEGEEVGSLEPERAAEVLVEVGDLGDGGSAPAGEPFTGSVGVAKADSLDWPGVVFVAELDQDELARDARAPLAAAATIASQTSQPLAALVLTEPLAEPRRRTVAGQLRARAPLSRIVFAEHPALASRATPAFAEALVKLMGPTAQSRPMYLLTSPWLSDALPILAGALRDANVMAEEIAGVSRVEFRDGDGLTFVRPVNERKLRARRRGPAAGNRMWILWCEPEVVSEDVGHGDAETEVLVAALDIEYDPEADALAQALAEARKALGVVTLENAEFVIDVGAGLGSIDNLETIVEPLRQALLDMGAPNVEIGATRKVTMDMSWLPDERQIGQTGVRVNPRVVIALGVSGAPQHIDWVGDRAAIFAFNLDAQAPLMTLNQRREQPKVYPVVGDLTRTVPRFIAALKSRE